MRHGTTKWNEKNIIQGRSENKLSRVGVKLTKNVVLQNKTTSFDIIFCSPLKRTVQTAKIMNKYHKVKIIKDERLIEIEQGIFTGRKKDSLTEKEKYQRYIGDKSCNMEEYHEVEKRVELFLDYIKTCEFQNVLIITHNVVASMLVNALHLNSSPLEAKNNYMNFKNAEIKIFEI